MNIWPWSRIHQLEEANFNLNRRLEQWESSLGKQLSAITPGLARVIAKLDAKYAESEFSAERKAESDRLGKEALKRMLAEAKAREPYNKALGDDDDVA